MAQSESRSSGFGPQVMFMGRHSGSVAMMFADCGVPLEFGECGEAEKTYHVACVGILD
jgi:hypothetical protein